MVLPSIYELCLPRANVMVGTVAESDYAANLASVLNGHASRDHTGAPTCFTNTYLIEELKELRVNVYSRLSGRGDHVSAVFRLDTSFCGPNLLNSNRELWTSRREFLSEEARPCQ